MQVVAAMLCALLAEVPLTGLSFNKEAIRSD